MTAKAVEGDLQERGGFTCTTGIYGISLFSRGGGKYKFCPSILGAVYKNECGNCFLLSERNAVKILYTINRTCTCHSLLNLAPKNTFKSCNASDRAR